MSYTTTKATEHLPSEEEIANRISSLRLVGGDEAEQKTVRRARSADHWFPHADFPL